MGRCRCGQDCGCTLTAGPGILIEGSGAVGDPYVVSADTSPHADVSWPTPAAWDQFTAAGITNMGGVIDQLGTDGAGAGTITVAGDMTGNDRRLYTLDDFAAADAEARVSWSSNDSGAQIGLGFRTQPDVAVVPWQNVFVIGDALVRRGVWQWQPPGTGAALTTNLHPPDLPSAAGWIVAAEGDGDTVTVHTAAPHYLSLIQGDMTRVTVGPMTDEAVVAQPLDATTFSFPSTHVGQWTGGTWRIDVGNVPVGIRRNLAARVQGNVMTLKHWFAVEPEPAWTDPLRSVAAQLPVTLADGSPPPDHGGAGLVIGHLTDNSDPGDREITIYRYQVLAL